MKNVNHNDKEVKILKTILYGLIAVALSSCVTARKVNLLQDSSKKYIPEYADTLSFEDYKIRTGDRLYIYVRSIDEKITTLFNAGQGNSNYYMRNGGNNQYGSNDLYTYLVDEDGNIQFPTIGNLYVRDLTARDVKMLLDAQLATLLVGHEGFNMISTDVQVYQRTFSIIGAGKSGRINIPKEKMTIYEAIAMAGDIAEFGDRSKVRIIRETNGVTEIKTFDLRSKDVINSEFYYIQPNDVIYLQKIPGNSFGINSAGTAVGVAATTLSFGVFIYALTTRIINAVNKAK